MPAETHTRRDALTTGAILELIGAIIPVLDDSQPLDLLSLEAAGIVDDDDLLEVWDAAVEEFGERTLGLVEGDAHVEELREVATVGELAGVLARLCGPDRRGDGLVSDLDSRAAIHDLVVHFYREVVFDELLAPMFDEVAEVDWSVHMPKLVDYWCRVILGHPGYDGYILASHRHLHSLEPLTTAMFDRWYRLWADAVDSGWAGPNAELAKSHAVRIGRVLARRIIGAEWGPVRPI